MKQIGSIIEMQRTAALLRAESKIISVVPTMGFLHEGHLSLIRLAKKHAGVVITTIFVNPTQFGPREDFSSYPRDLERDQRVAESAGSDILFIPSTEEMYPSPYHTFVEVEKLTSVLEGKVRPTHFRGVATVVGKLFNITKPHIAVFGQKDAQQAVVIRQMVRDMNFDVEVMVGPIVREPDGLAMSSRNVYLSPDERKQSVILSESLRRAEEMVATGERESSMIAGEIRRMIGAKAAASVDYVSVTSDSTLEEIATLQPGTRALISLPVRFGKTRLIDNSVVEVR